MAEPSAIGRDELRKKVAPMVPRWLDTEAVLEGVALSLVPPSDRTLPIIKNPFRRDVLYAWSEDDASATKLALELLSQLGQGLLNGPKGLINLGLGIKEVVCFLIDLKRHSVRVSDPLQIKILVVLRESRGGLTDQQLRQRLGKEDDRPTLAEIDAALDALAHASAASGQKPLVRADRMIWKSLV